MAFPSKSTLCTRTLLSLLLTAGLSNLAVAANTYCCQDNGRKVCSDGLPEICRGKPYKILDGSGLVIKEVGPPPTAEQKAAAAEAAEKKKLDDQKALEQKRRDSALLQTYSTPEDIDMAQQKAENDVNLAVSDSNSKIEAAKKKRRKFEMEAQATPGKPETARGLNDTDREIKQLEEMKAMRLKDLENIRTRYEADRNRFAELTGRRSSKPMPGPSSK